MSEHEESTLRSLLDKTSFMMGVVEVADDDSDIIHLYDTPATYRFFGIPLGTMAGRSARELGVPAAVIAEWVGYYRESERLGREVRFEYEHPGQAGACWLASTVACLGRSGGARARFSYVTEDVTERRREERRLRDRELHLRLAMDRSLVIAFEWDIASDRVRRLESTEEALPATDQGPDMFEGVVRVIHADDRDLFRANIRRALESADGLYRSEHRIVRPSGEVRWHLESGRVEFDEHRRPIRLIGITQDATDRHRHDAEIRRQARLINVSHEPIMAWSPDAGLIDWNAGAEQLYGYTRAEALGRDVHELLRTESPVPLHEVLAHIERAGEWTGVQQHLDKGGREIIVESRQQVVTIDGARLILESNRDITEARRAHERAEADRALLEAILEAAPAGIIVADVGGKLLRFNPANELLWGPAPLSRSVDEYREWKGWWADESPRRGRRVEPHEWAMTRALRGETVRGDIVEIEPFDRPGVRRTMVNTGAPVRDAAGRVIGAVVAQMDITNLVAAQEALRDSEVRFRSIAEAIPGLVFVHTSAGHNTFVNQSFCTFAGRAPEGLLEDRWLDLIHEADREAASARFREAVRQGRSYEAEYRMRRHDGAWRWFLIRSVPQKTADGIVKQWIGTAIDITERIQGEEALKEADRRKDEFISILAHELRNPLAPVKTAVEILRRGDPMAPRAERAREVIDRQVTHMARLIDDLLDVSRIARGKLALKKERCDLAAIARETAEDYRANLEAAGLTLVIRSPPDPLWVHGDPVRLAQMVGNLLNNAGRFTEPGGRVEVRAAADGEPPQAVVTVSDTGVGIDPPLLARLFDPFAQAEQDLARTKGGLGLGLALTKGLAELHGGQVTAESAGRGRGARFTLRLPLSLTRDLQRRADEPARAEGAGVRILVVEDNQDAAETLADLLEMAGHEVKVAFDGASAIELAKGFRPRVVISDLGLPGELGGYAVARALRRAPETRGALLVALSGYANEEVQQRSDEAGFDAHFAKPPDLTRLEHAIASARAHDVG